MIYTTLEKTLGEKYRNLLENTKRSFLEKQTYTPVILID